MRKKRARLFTADSFLACAQSARQKNVSLSYPPLFQFQIKDEIKAARLEATKAYNYVR
jgi:hypothetical protein